MISELAELVTEKLMKGRDKWAGPSSRLLDVLLEHAHGYNWHSLPAQANQLSRELFNLRPVLRDKGFNITRTHSGVRTITIQRLIPRAKAQDIEMEALITRLNHLVLALGTVTIDQVTNLFGIKRQRAIQIMCAYIDKESGMLTNVDISITHN